MSKLTSQGPILRISNRSVASMPGKNYVMPSDLRDVVKYLDKQRPQFTCVYFSAAWNPICESIERDYDNFCKANSHFTHVKVDCDAAPQVKVYFDARVEPQFLFLLNGAEIKRQVGFNFNLLQDIVDEVTEFHLQDNNYIGDSGDTWERFYDAFDRFEQHGQSDRDAFRM